MDRMTPDYFNCQFQIGTDQRCYLSQCENVSLASPQRKLWVNQACQPTLAQCCLTQQAEGLLTCPQSSSPTPTNRHQSHCSTLRGAQLKGFPPHCTITICSRNTGRDIVTVTRTNTVSREKPALHHLSLLHQPVCPVENTSMCQQATSLSSSQVGNTRWHGRCSQTRMCNEAVMTDGMRRLWRSVLDGGHFG